MKNLRLIKLLGENDYKIFENIFREFERAPFFEKWSDEEILEEFGEFLKEGKMFTYDNKGLMNIQFNKKKSNLLPYSDWGNFIYLSDIVVLEKYRGNGIASSMFDYLIAYAQNLNFNSIYFRTNLVGSMSESIGTKRGFRIVTNSNGGIITDEVSFLRQNGAIQSDTRKYLVKGIK